MQFELIFMLFWVFIILFYKYSFWTFSIQLKEYRFDRFKEYVWTGQWKKALLNPMLFLESIFLFFGILFLAFGKEDFAKFSFYLLLLLEIWFIAIKAKKNQIITPKLTLRLWLLSVLNGIIFALLLPIYLFSEAWIIGVVFYFNIVFMVPYLTIFISNIFWLPVVNFQKARVINSAVNASKKYSKPIKIWVTGSYWKSSVKEFLASILEKEGNLLKTPENINTDLWVSAIILKRLNDSFDYFLAEMWAYRIWEIELMGKIVDHKYWFLTAVGNQHIWLFWSQENIKKWKFEIANKVFENDWILYVNWDNQHILDYLGEHYSDKSDKIVVYWIDNKYSDAVSEITLTINWFTDFNFFYKWESYVFKTNLIWKHNILNITWVIAFCLDIGITPENLAKYLLEIQLPDSTWNISKIKNHTIIDDTYNLSEHWLLSGLDVLATFENSEKILVVDDILELWKEAHNIHFKLWNKIATDSLADKVLFCWVNYREDFVSWLLNWGFEGHQIISDLSDISDTATILFEGRKAWTLIDNLEE